MTNIFFKWNSTQRKKRKETKRPKTLKIAVLIETKKKKTEEKRTIKNVLSHRRRKEKVSEEKRRMKPPKMGGKSNKSNGVVENIEQLKGLYNKQLFPYW